MRLPMLDHSLPCPGSLANCQIRLNHVGICTHSLTLPYLGTCTEYLLRRYLTMTGGNPMYLADDCFGSPTPKPPFPWSLVLSRWRRARTMVNRTLLALRIPLMEGLGFVSFDRLRSTARHEPALVGRAVCRYDTPTNPRMRRCGSTPEEYRVFAMLPLTFVPSFFLLSFFLSFFLQFLFSKPLSYCRGRE